jgi:hypothetical protein
MMSLFLRDMFLLWPSLSSTLALPWCSRDSSGQASVGCEVENRTSGVDSMHSWRGGEGAHVGMLIQQQRHQIWGLRRQRREPNLLNGLGVFKK